MKRIGVVLILIFAFVGLADSVYLAQHETAGTPLICNIQHLSGCNVVANSSYSRVFGVPVSEFGVLFYAILFVLASLELVLFDRALRRALQGLALVGTLASLYFSFVQVFFIGAICVYCAASAIITLIVLVLATLIEPIRKKKQAPKPTEPPQPSQQLHMPPQ